MFLPWLRISYEWLFCRLCEVKRGKCVGQGGIINKSDLVSLGFTGIQGNLGNPTRNNGNNMESLGTIRCNNILIYGSLYQG